MEPRELNWHWQRLPVITQQTELKPHTKQAAFCPTGKEHSSARKTMPLHPSLSKGVYS